MIKKYFTAYKLDIYAIIFLILAVGIFFYQSIIFGKLPVPTDTLIGLYHPWRDLYAATNPRGIPFKNFLITDPVRQQIPWRKIVIDDWKKGIIPKWNPYNFSGTPLSANIQAAAYYPLNFIFLFNSFIGSWIFLIMLQPLLAGIFMYFYLRNLKMHYLSALVGAVTFAFCGFNIAWMTWGTIGHVVLWLPLILLAIDKLCVPDASKYGKSIWTVVFLSAVLMQFTAGHSQLSLYVTLTSLFYLIHKFKISGINHFKDKRIFIPGLTLIILFFLYLFPQIVSLVKFLPQTSRLNEINAYQQPGWFIPIQNFLQFIFPDFFGNPATMNYWGTWNYGEFIGYIGIIPLFFAFCVIFTKPIKDNGFWKFMLLIAIIFTIKNPISDLIYILKIPVLSVIQPTRLIFLIDFALSVLAAYGLNSWITRRTRMHLVAAVISVAVIIAAWIFVLFNKVLPISQDLHNNLLISKNNLILPTLIYIVFITIYFITSKINKSKMIIPVVFLFLVITLFDLFRFGWKFTPFTPIEYFFPTTKIISYLASQPKPFRIMSLDKSIMPPNVSAYYGLETIEGYDPIYLSRYEKFMAALSRAKPDISSPYGFNRIISSDNINSSLIPFLNVKYILSLTILNKPFLREILKEGETLLYEDIRFQPRFYFASKIIKSADDQETINKLFTGGISVAVIKENLNISGISPNEGKINIDKYSESEIIISYELNKTGLLVSDIINADGWHAYLDNQPVIIYEANFMFQGVEAPAGIHTIKLKYE